MLALKLWIRWSLVCSKTKTKFAFRRYKHSKVTVSHFR